jgi:hypothetical protein
VKHGNRFWVKNHYGPKGAYHPGHWIPAGQNSNAHLQSNGTSIHQPGR